MSSVLIDPQATRELNRLARERMKESLLRDILADLMVCELEGFDKLEYIYELEYLINSLKKNSGMDIQHYFSTK